MLRPAQRSRRGPVLAAALAALLAAPALAVGSAGAARADGVRQQETWVLNALNVAGAWQRTRGSGVTVALIDSGVSGLVPDLVGSVTTGRDFSGVNTPPGNPNWGVHGTWMASLIAGHGHDGGANGIIGVAPAAKILSIRAVTDQGDPGYRRYQHESESRVQGHLADAINYATTKRVSVISMSLGYQGASLPVRKAISAALAQGIVVVASSGNSGGATTGGQHGNAPYSFPADYPGVLGVGAVAQSGQPAGFSSNNLSVQVAAPGVRVPAQGRDGQYWLVSGTSPACALTAGAAALIKSVYPTLAPALVVQAITASTTNKPHGGYDEQVGFGTVDATAALKLAGRLARDQGTGRGLAAAARFGGGPAAIPPVPVAPRTKRQLLVDSLIAMLCLAVVLVVTFRLIVTRRPAVVGAPIGWGPGAEAPAGRAGAGPPDGWAGAAGGAPGGAGTPGAGPPGSAVSSGAGGGWPGSDGAGYGRSEGYWASGGYKPPAAPRPPAEYGPPTGFQPPADPGPPAEPGPWSYQGPPGPGLSPGSAPPPDYPWRTDPSGLAEYRAPVGYQGQADSGPQPGSGPPSGYRSPGGSARPAGYGAPGEFQRPADPVPPAGNSLRRGNFEPPSGNGRAAGGALPKGNGLGGSLGPRHAGYGRPEASFGPPPASNGLEPPGYRPPAGHRPSSRPAQGTPAAPAGRTADVDSGPLTGYPEPGEPQAPPAGPPSADDDTWPSSGSW